MFGRNERMPWVLWLPHIQIGIYVIALLIFIYINWGETHLMIRFIWTTYFSDQYGLGPEAMYPNADYAVFKIGRNMGRLFVCMGPAWLINRGLTALLPFFDADEYALYKREKAIEQRLKKLNDFEDILDITEKLAPNIQATANELNRLIDKALKLRLEIDALELKKKAKTKAAISQSEKDLFTQTTKPRKRAQSKPPKYWGARKPSTPPRF